MTDSKTNQRLGDRLEQMDREVKVWTKLTRSRLIGQLLHLGLHDKIELSRSLKKIRKQKKEKGEDFKATEPLVTSLHQRLKKQKGDLEAVAFSFSRQGIFLEHGVGKGRPVKSSKAQAAKKPWLAPILAPSIEDLADLLEENYADIAAEELRLLIPGVIDIKTSVS